MSQASPVVIETENLIFNPPPAEPPLFTRGRIRVRPEDFIVDEQIDIEFSDDGEHLWLLIEKRERNSDEVARALSRAAGVRRVDVGYAGLKDKNAVTRQWFSVRIPGRRDIAWCEDLGEGLRVIETAWHRRKLHRGALKGNSFEIIVRDIEAETEPGHDVQALVAKRVKTLISHGAPNYFGPQRFGARGYNIDKAQAMFAGKIRVRDRHQRGLYLSAARALIFNAVLAARVQDGSWCQARIGDAMMLAGSRSFFVAENIDEALHARLAGADIHPSGPLWGVDAGASCGEVHAFEATTAERYGALSTGLAETGMKSARRALRVMPTALGVRWIDDRTALFCFGLPAGSYATIILREFFAHLE